MPGKLIKLFDTQADWQSGTLENLDATSTPGVIIPTGDYTKTYDSKTEWDQGSKADVVSDAEGRIMLDRPLRGNTSVGGTGHYEYDRVYMGQRISPRGLLTEVRMGVGSSSGSGTYLYVTDLSGNILWYQSMPSDGLWIGYPNLLVSEDVIVWVRASDWLYNVGYADPGDYPPGVTENGRIGDSLTTQPNYSRPLWVNYRCEYAESGTWLSPWLAHGIADPQSGLVSLRAETPSGTSVIPHVRYSSNGGTTYTQWYDLDDRRMTDLQGTHVQLRLTLTTDDTKQTPVVDRAAMLVGKLHRWTSPVIDLAGVDADATLMLATSQTELDVVREVREYPNFTFTRSSPAYNPEDGSQVAVNEPRYVDGPFSGSKALFVEEGTTNLPLGYSYVGDTRREAAASSILGGLPTYRIYLVGDTRGHLRCTFNMVQGTRYTCSFYLYDPNNKFQAARLYDDSMGFFEDVYELEDVAPGIKRVLIGGVSTVTKLTSHGMVLYWKDSVVSGDEYWMAGAQVEAKPYATSFTDGTRSPEDPTIPTAGVLSPQEGTWEQWVYVNEMARRQVAGQYPNVFYIPRAGGGNGILVCHSPTSPNWVLETRNDANQSTSVSVPDSHTPDGWHLFRVTWKQGDKATLSIDGVERGVIDDPNLPSAFGTASVGRSGDLNYLNTAHVDVRLSSIARTDDSDLVSYQSGEPLPKDEHTTYKMAGGSWESVGTVFPCSGRQTLQARLTLTKTDSVAQSLDKCSLWDAIVLKMLDRPQLTLSPPQVTHVTAYVENSEPLIEYTASLPGVPEAKKVHIRVPVPEGSSLAYCQEVAERVLIGKSKERLALVCQVPLITRLRFSELVPVSIPYIGYTRSRPYLARVQKMAHDVLAGNPHTKLWLGDFLPDDAEALVRLLLKEG